MAFHSSMLSLFQFLFLIFILLAIVNVFRRQRDGSLSGRGAIFWAFIWLAAGIVVLYPNSSALLAQVFGIGRGADLVVYVSLATMFFIVFRLHLKVESIRREVTKVVRTEAIKHENI